MVVSFVSSYVSIDRIESPQQVVKNLTKIAVPIIALAGVKMMQKAQAITMAECFANCDRHRDASELAKLICYALCAVFSKG